MMKMLELASSFEDPSLLVWRCVWRVVVDVSEDRSAFILSAKQSVLKDTTILQNVRSCSSIDL